MMSIPYSPLPKRPTTRIHTDQTIQKPHQKQLLKHGYVLLPPGYRLPRPLLHHLLEQAQEKTDWRPFKVLQVEEPAPDEVGRYLTIVTEGPHKQKIKTRLLQWIMRTIKSSLGYAYQAGKPVHLKSEPGGREQALHTDFNNTNRYHDACFGATVLIPLNGEAQLKVGPDRYITVPKNRVLVYMGNFVHAGCAYESINHRVQAFVVPPGWNMPHQKVRLFDP